MLWNKSSATAVAIGISCTLGCDDTWCDNHIPYYLDLACSTKIQTVIKNAANVFLKERVGWLLKKKANHQLSRTVDLIEKSGDGTCSVLREPLIDDCYRKCNVI